MKKVNPHYLLAKNLMNILDIQAKRTTYNDKFKRYEQFTDKVNGNKANQFGSTKTIESNRLK